MTDTQLEKMITEKKSIKMRHEFKHSLNKADDLLITHRLQKLFRHDTNSSPDGIYKITSLYFDTPYDKALRQKTDGVNRREKFRFRYYNDNTDFIRLEKKLKINGLCGKYGATITKQQMEMLLNGDIEFLLHSENPLFIELYSKMKGQLLAPKTLVRYDREAFVYPPGNVRVTLDRNLRTGLSSTDFLNPHVLYADVSDSLAVLEVKYDEYLPEIVKMAVQTPNRQSTANSKYAICRKYD